MRAGADKVFLPYIIGGLKMAQSITKPAVTDFIDFTVHNKEMGLEMGELHVDEGSRLNGFKLMDSGIRKEMDIIIVAIRKKTGEMSFNPSSTFLSKSMVVKLTNLIARLKSNFSNR